jgi:hypothetical protein
MNKGQGTLLYCCQNQDIEFCLGELCDVWDTPRNLIMDGVPHRRIRLVVQRSMLSQPGEFIALPRKE